MIAGYIADSATLWRERTLAWIASFNLELVIEVDQEISQLSPKAQSRSESLR